MSERITDPTVPGKAGLYFNLRLLSRNAHIAAIPSERAAREALEHWCHHCGQSASFGYGMTRATEGVWSCSDAGCRASAEAQAAETRKSEPSPVQAPKAVPAPLAEPLIPPPSLKGGCPAEPVLDLFGAAA